MASVYPRGSQLPVGLNKLKVGSLGISSFPSLFTSLSNFQRKCRNMMEWLKKEKHSWELWGKKEYVFDEENNNNNLIFIIITIIAEDVIMTGNLILSSAL